MIESRSQKNSKASKPFILRPYNLIQKQQSVKKKPIQPVKQQKNQFQQPDIQYLHQQSYKSPSSNLKSLATNTSDFSSRGIMIEKRPIESREMPKKSSETELDNKQMKLQDNFKLDQQSHKLSLSQKDSSKDSLRDNMSSLNQSQTSQSNPAVDQVSNTTKQTSIQSPLVDKRILKTYNNGNTTPAKDEISIPQIIMKNLAKQFIQQTSDATENVKENQKLKKNTFFLSNSTLQTRIQDDLVNKSVKLNVKSNRTPIGRMEGDISMLSSLNEKQILPAVENKNNYDIDKNSFKPDCLPYLISKKKFRPKITAKSWIIMEKETSSILCSKNDEEIREVASLTKIMTCLVTILLLKKLKMDSDKTYLNVSKTAASMVGTSASLKQGDIISITDLLYGLMLPSGNDAAYCLAERFGHYLYFESEEFKLRCDRAPENLKSKIEIKNPVRYFLREMNRTAKELGMTNTHFANPHGLINKYNRSTARDMGILTCEAMNNDFFRKIVKTKIYSGDVIENVQFGKRIITWENTNRLLNKGFEGVKTGITTAAGPCLSSCITIQNYCLVVIVLSSKSMEKRWTEVPKLVDWASKKLEKLFVPIKNPQIEVQKIQGMNLINEIE